MQSGIVIRNDGPRYWVDSNSVEIPCTLRGRLKREQQRVTSLVVVGDQVQVEQFEDGTGVIHEVQPRRSELSRPGFAGYVHVIAANVDQLIVVQAARQPGFKLGLADRFLALANRGGMDAVVVVNKCDLEQEAVIRSWTEPLERAGITVLQTSTTRGEGIAELRSLLQGRTSVLAGQSGVGKSSLINSLYPEATARTTPISQFTNKGRHTTTSSTFYRLPDGGYLVDTPGIRTLELFDDDEQQESVTSVFPEIGEAAVGCKFRDCSHSHEPRCAVKTAVAQGVIPAERYQSYLRLSGSVR